MRLQVAMNYLSITRHVLYYCERKNMAFWLLHL
jgi:hypothetical protein